MKITDLYESEYLTDKDEIIKWMNKSFLNFNPGVLIIEPDGLVYNGSLALISNVKELEVSVKSVSDQFSCQSSSLISLKGCPKIVGYNFTCSYSNITSLKYCPQSIGRSFYCRDTKITDPKEYRYALYSEIGSDFNSGINLINEIINTYKGSANRKHWPYAINLLSKVKL